MNFNSELISTILDLTKVIRDILAPFAIVLFLIGVIKDTWDYFTAKDKIEIDEESISTLSWAALKNNIVGLVIFLAFPYLALIPAVLVDSIITELHEISPVEKLYQDNLAPAENTLRNKGYLTSDNEAQWNQTSLQSKLSFIRTIRAKDAAIKLKNSNIDEDNYVDNADALDSYTVSGTIDNLSSFDLFEFNPMDTLLTIFIFVINFIRNGIEYIVGKLFEILLYLDYLIGIFVAFIALLPWARQNMMNWFIENLSLLAWAIVFILIDWIMALISLSAISGDVDGMGMSAWTMPLLSLFVLSAVGYFAAKITGREAGGGTVQTAVRTGMSAIPAAGAFLGAAYGSTMGGLASSKAGQAAGSFLKKHGSTLLTGAKNSPANKAIDSVKSAVDYFKPQPKPTAAERTASALEDLNTKF